MFSQSFQVDIWLAFEVAGYKFIGGNDGVFIYVAEIASMCNMSELFVEETLS